MTTHIRVSSTCTPTPLTLELGLVLEAGNMNSPWGDHAVLVRRVSAIAVLATDLGGGMAEGIVYVCVDMCVRVGAGVVEIYCGVVSGDYSQSRCCERRSNARGEQSRSCCGVVVPS